MAMIALAVITGCMTRPEVKAELAPETGPRMNERRAAEQEMEPTATPTPVQRKMKTRRAESWGEYYFRKGDFRRAVAHLREDVKKDPGNPVLWRHLGSAYGLGNDFNNAIACYEAALRRDDKDQKTHYNLSLMHNFKGSLEEAESAASAPDTGWELRHRGGAIPSPRRNVRVCEKIEECVKVYQALHSIGERLTPAGPMRHTPMPHCGRFCNFRG